MRKELLQQTNSPLKDAALASSLLHLLPFAGAFADASACCLGTRIWQLQELLAHDILLVRRAWLAGCSAAAAVVEAPRYIHWAARTRVKWHLHHCPAHYSISIWFGSCRPEPLERGHNVVISSDPRARRHALLPVHMCSAFYSRFMHSRRLRLSKPARIKLHAGGIAIKVL